MSLIIKEKIKRVLVVDDIADNLFLAQFILESQGYEVVTASSGKAALTQVITEKFPPNLIILDLMMPVMDGFEVIYRLHNRLNLSHIPVLLMTADTCISRETAQNAGADGILYKPLNLEQFVITVNTIYR